MTASVLEMGGARRRAVSSALLKVFLHEFPSSGGITGVALLAESHMSIHTWPEKDYAAIDIFMCGHADPRRALDVLIVQLKPTPTLVEHFIRGADRAIRPRVKNRKAAG
jgi:S-adenosylmethionine decarboxylase